MGEIGLVSRIVNPPIEAVGNRLVGGARSNFGVDDGLLEGGHGTPTVGRNVGVDDGLLEGGPRTPTPGRNFGVDDGLLGGVNPPFYPPSADDEPEMEKPVSRPRTPVNPWKPDERPAQPLPPFDGDSRFNVNYATKKNIAQGMMDIALLTANASQLRYVMRSPYWDVYHKVNVTLISLSIALQIVVGVVLIFVGRFDFKRLEERKRTQNMNNIVVALIFTITVVNIFIATFGIDDERTTFMRWTKDQESMTTPRPRLPSELDP